jgi:phospholipase A1/A2
MMLTMNNKNALIYISLTMFFANNAFSSDNSFIEEAFMRCKEAYPSSQEADQRLACFDQIQTTKINSDDDSHQLVITPEIAELPKKIESEQTYLERKWRLQSNDNWLISDLETHLQNYIITSISNNPNNFAFSPSQATTEDRNLQNKDVQFQISLKTQLMHDIPVIRSLPWVTSSRLWVAYTQKSYWQIYNSEESRPFRESNFAPEIILSLGLDDQVNPFMPRMANLGLIHESNGRDNPTSRSWNRLYLESAWQLNESYTLIPRPWYRIPEIDTDDNPDIEKFLGYGDITLRWDDFKKNKAISLLLRNNLRSDNKGYAKLSMYYEPFEAENIKLYMSLSSGYGETLVDYNHSQTVFGVGFAVGE